MTDAKPAFSDLTMSADDVISVQREANDKILAARDDAKIENVTVSKIVSEMGGSLKGVLDDLFAGESVYDAFTRDNRLRGLGALMILISSIFLVIAQS